MNLGQNDGPNEKKPGGPDRPKNNFWTPLVIALALVLLFAADILDDVGSDLFVVHTDPPQVFPNRRKKRPER